MNLGTISSGVGQVTNINSYKGCPQFLVFEIGTTPQSIKVTVNGRLTIVDLNTAGINALANPRVSGRAANSFIIPIANGLITDVTLDIQVTNNVASTFDLFGITKNFAPVDAPGFYVSKSQSLNAGTVVEFTNFTYLALPSIAASDFVQIVGNKRSWSGEVAGGQWSTRNEPAGLRALLSQYETQAVSAKNAIDNYNNEYEAVYFTPGASQTVFVQRLVPFDTRGEVPVA